MSRYSMVDESKRKSSLLKDNSWIKKEVNDEKEVDQNSNFGRSILGRYKSNENLTSPTENTTTIISSSTGTESGPSRTVQSLTKRYPSGVDELDSSSTTTSSSTTYKDGTKTTVTTSRTSVVKPPIKTKTFSEKIFTDPKTTSEDIKTVRSLPPISPTKTTKRESYTVTTYEDSLQDGNKTVKTVTIPSSPTKSPRSETVTVTTFQDTIVSEDRKSVKSTPAASPSRIISDTTYTSTTPTSKTKSYSYSSKSSTDDQLFDTLIPTSIKDTYASDTSSVNRNDKGSETSSTTYTRRSYTDSRPEDYMSENVSTRYVKTVMSDRPESSFDNYTSSRSSTETLYSTPERKVYVEKDICTYCQKPILYETKMLLEEADIKCHATCFKCDVCKNSLGHLKAGDNMWVYRRNVYCENCFYTMKDKWHR